MSSLHVILPVQYLQSVDSRLAQPQKRLMLAVLKAVLDDCEPISDLRAAGRDARDDLRTHEQAIAYVESPDRSWPFSFVNICEAIGLDADSIRRALKHRGGDVAHLPR